MRKLYNISLSVAISLSFTTLLSTANAQSFKETTNPLKNKHVKSGRTSEPCLVDINKDGKVDMFSGEYNYSSHGVVNSAIYYYINTGSELAPSYALADDAQNPLKNISIPGLLIPRFVDIDKDGDDDCFIASNDGSITFLLNTGTSKNPIFEKQSAAFNPLSMVKLQGLEISNFVFSDVDNDKDFDCLVSDDLGDVAFFKNNGTETKASFAAQTNNAFSFLKNTDISSIAFYDWNKDGYADFFVNNVYYQNNANTANTSFTRNDLKAPVINGEEMLSPNFATVNNQTVIISGNKNGSFNYLTASSLNIQPTLSLSAYPNPSNKVFTIDLSKTNGDKLIKITDVKGNLINTYKTNNASIVIGENLQPGVYFIHVLSNDNEVANQKIVKI